MSTEMTKRIRRSSGIVLLTLGVALFGGSYVLEIDGLRASGIGLGLLGLVLSLAASRASRTPEE